MTQCKHVELQQTPDGIVFKGWEDEIPDSRSFELSGKYSLALREWQSSSVILLVDDAQNEEDILLKLIDLSRKELERLDVPLGVFLNTPRNVTPFVEVIDGKVCYKEPVKVEEESDDNWNELMDIATARFTWDERIKQMKSKFKITRV